MDDDETDVEHRTDSLVGRSIAVMAVFAVLVCGVAQATDGDVAGRSNRVDASHLQRKTRPVVGVRPVPTDASPIDRPLDLSEPVIRKAIADSKDPLDDVVMPRAATFGAGGPTDRQQIDQGFKRAEIPTCVTPAAYTFDPPQVGPLAFGGLLALPFLAHAIATGKCRH